MKYSTGDLFPQLALHTSKGARLFIPIAGVRYTHVQFRRFSGCPICNTHIAALIRNKARLDAAGVREVLFFHSAQEDVADFHDDLPFDIVGDPEKRYYRQFGVESSWRFISWTAILAALSGMVRGGMSLKMTGGMLGLPAEFLVASDGRIKAAHYGKHAYDQWSVEEIVDLVQETRSAAVVSTSKAGDKAPSEVHLGQSYGETQ
jgi:peroxiredoxin